MSKKERGAFTKEKIIGILDTLGINYLKGKNKPYYVGIMEKKISEVI